MADALFSASFLNACLRHAPDVAMANIAPIVNTRGPLFVHPGGIVKRTTYHVLYMYARMLGERVAAARVETPALTHAGRSVAALDAVATCDPARKRWCIALVNRRPDQPLECEVRLAGKPLEGRYAAWTLSGDSPEAYNSIERPDRVMPQRVELECRAGKVMLPPHSLTVVEVVLVR
jgi:alpha-N-arabinofuranosidase